MPTREDVRDSSVRLLEAAAARLRDRGWQRGGYGEEEGPNCVRGALTWAASEVPQWMLGPELDVAECALTDLLDEEPTVWNDFICPGADAAVDALLTAAKEVAGADT